MESRVRAAPLANGDDAPVTPTVLITGAAERVGKTIAIHLAERGARVIINHFGQHERATETVKEINGTGEPRAFALEADIGDPDGCGSLIARAVQRWGRLDAVIHNASTFSQGEVLDVTPDEWDRVMAVNLKGPFFLSQAAARHMIAHGGGKIISILGNSLYEGWPDFAVHAISKSALARTTEILALAFSPLVQCLGVAPAEMLPTGDSEKDAGAREVRDVDLVQGDPRSLAEMLWHLLQAPAYLNGAIIPLDGGKRLV